MGFDQLMGNDNCTHKNTEKGALGMGGWGGRDCNGDLTRKYE